MIRQRKPLQRKTPIRRSAPPKRRTWLKQKRATPRRVRTVTRDEAYKAAVRQLPCAGLPGGIHAIDCRARLRRDASHLSRDGGQGMKGSDHACVPHSRPCHDLWSSGKAWSQAQRRGFMAEAVARTHAELERRGLYTSPARRESGVPW
jgi:hypothetical protein